MILYLFLINDVNIKTLFQLVQFFDQKHRIQSWIFIYINFNIISRTLTHILFFNILSLSNQNELDLNVVLESKFFNIEALYHQRLNESENTNSDTTVSIKDEAMNGWKVHEDVR